MTQSWRRKAPNAPYTNMLLKRIPSTRNGTVLEYKIDILTPTVSVRTERDLMILQEFRREMRLCDERACECTCHCHAGAGMCYGDTGETNVDTESRFHARKPNSAHKSAHRACPKEGREHNRK